MGGGGSSFSGVVFFKFVFFKIVDCGLFVYYKINLVGYVLCVGMEKMEG